MHTATDFDDVSASESSSDEDDVNDDEKHSPAKDCIRLLRQNDKGEGAKLIRKYNKRENERKIRKRYWHLRKKDEALSGSHYDTIEIDDDTVTFSHMYHYYTCGKFLDNEAALRRVPCNCEACDTMIRKPWKPGLDDYRNQP